MTLLTDLRKGDKILIEVTVTDRRIAGESLVCKLPSKNDIVIHSDADIHQVTQQSLKAGDRVKWREKGNWWFGTVLALEEDQEPTAKAQGRVWAWVKEDARWPRRTFDAKDLQRA